MIKLSFPIPAWLGRVLSKRTVELAETHGRAGRQWRFLRGTVEINMNAKVD